MDAALEKFYLSMDIDASQSLSTFSSTIRYIGKNWESQSRLFMGLTKKGDALLFDPSSIFSRGKNVFLAEKGYYRHRVNLRQMNFVMAFSPNDFIPTVLKPLPGSGRNVKSLNHFLEEFDVLKGIFLLDRWFFSFSNVEYFLANDIDFIQPLSRVLKVIDSIPSLLTTCSHTIQGERDTLFQGGSDGEDGEYHIHLRQ